MKNFVAPGLALVGPDEVQEAVFLQELLGDVRSEVGAGSPEGVRNAPLPGLGIAPQDVKYLGKMTVRKCAI